MFFRLKNWRRVATRYDRLARTISSGSLSRLTHGLNESSTGGGDLERWLAPFLARLGQKARRRMCPLYVAGLIGPGDRKSVEPMACGWAPGDSGQFPHFVSSAVWNEARRGGELP